MVRSRGEWRLAGLLLGVCAASGLSSCWSKAAPDTALESSGGPLEDDIAAQLTLLPDAALNATWQELGVPGAGNRPALASTPTGFLALSRRSIGDSRAPAAWESHLYRSADGIRWQRVEVTNANDDLWLRGVAYGGGHYVLAGMRFGGGDGVIFHSTDGESWDELPVATGAPSGLSDVVFAGSRFFALSTFRTLLSSTDGTAWTPVDLGSTASPLDVTFGNGQYLLVGSGDLQRSTDGLQWSPTQLDCTMPGACITDPGGNVAQSVHYRAVFAAGSFFIDQASSTDGQTWQPLPGIYPHAAVNEYVLGRTPTDELAVWSASEAPRRLTSVRYIETLSVSDRPTRMLWNGAVEPDELSTESFPNDSPLPERIEFPIPGESDCKVAACVIVGERLYLVSTASSR